MKRREILLVDAVALHRAAWTSFLRDWAEDSHAAVVSVSPVALPLTAGPDACFALVILTLNCASVRAPDTLACLDLLSKRMSGVPVVILSDRHTDAEVVAALRAGVRGFVPACTEPEVALQALSYIMGGGSFFPAGPLLRRFEAKSVEPSRTASAPDVRASASAVVPIKGGRRPSAE